MSPPTSPRTLFRCGDSNVGKWDDQQSSIKVGVFTSRAPGFRTLPLLMSRLVVVLVGSLLISGPRRSMVKMELYSSQSYQVKKKDRERLQSQYTITGVSMMCNLNSQKKTDKTNGKKVGQIVIGAWVKDKDSLF